MRIASIADIKAKFSGYLKESEQGPVIVTRNGKPVAVLIAMSDEDEIERVLLAYSPAFRGLLGAARERILEGEGIAHDDFWRQVETPEGS